MLYNNEQLINIRRDIHQNPELGFKEFQTQQKIISYLLSINIESSQIKHAAGTGLIVDLTGRGVAKGDPSIICFRADIDALEMFELNHDLPYRSDKKAAHMCGHDGHTVCLMGFAALFMETLSELKVPCDKTIRLLFQPCEEGTKELKWGAPLIIQEGWLDGVDEIYGFHNLPSNHLPGKLYVKPGAVMAEIIIVDIKITGLGGHGSAPEKCRDPIQPTVDILHSARELIRRYQEEKKDCRFTLPCVHAGDTKNVIPDIATIQGTFRCLREEDSKQFKEEFKLICQSICEEYGCKLDINLNSAAKTLFNTEKEAENVRRVAVQHFGQENVIDGVLPIYASEDFAYYTEKVPGAFFFLSSKKNEGDQIMLHSANFDFPDELVDIGARFWYALAKDRLQF